MNNDLISREALKAEFKRSANSVRNWKEGALNSGNDESAIRADAVLAYLTEVKGIIDNAPSVTSYTLEDLEKAKNNGYKWGKIDGKKERMQADIIVAGKCPIEADGNCPLRPQGEWIIFYTPKMKKVFKCDKCMAVSIQGQTNFCYNCGAKMKGGAK